MGVLNGQLYSVISHSGVIYVIRGVDDDSTNNRTSLKMYNEDVCVDCNLDKQYLENKSMKIYQMKSELIRMYQMLFVQNYLNTINRFCLI